MTLISLSKITLLIVFMILCMDEAIRNCTNRWKLEWFSVALIFQALHVAITLYQCLAVRFEAAQQQPQQQQDVKVLNLCSLRGKEML